mgnify:CR=1 FL=1
MINDFFPRGILEKNVKSYSPQSLLFGHIQKGVAVRDADGVVINTAPYSASYKRLAEDWNWERHTVQSFIEELTALSVITSKRQGNVYAFFIGKKSYKQLVL